MNNKIILFGASKLGELVYEILKNNNEIVAFCDNDKDKWGKKIKNINIIPPQTLINFGDCKIVISSTYYKEISKQLLQMNVRNFKVFNYGVIDVNENSNVLEEYAQISYSQDGEDMILKEIFSCKSEGFYVDIGAHHPKRFSNTYNFYKNGWRGINIDPLVGVKGIFDELRPRDINLEIGISDNIGQLNYYMYDEPAFNTFSKEACERAKSKFDIEPFQVKKIEVDRLENILNKHAANMQIDLMNIDVEGYELNVLKSNDWEKWVPKVILVEIKDNNFENIKNNSIHRYLIERYYELLAKTNLTGIYKNKNY